jgi:hypothetical protein
VVLLQSDVQELTISRQACEEAASVGGLFLFDFDFIAPPPPPPPDDERRERDNNGGKGSGSGNPPPPPGLHPFIQGLLDTPPSIPNPREKPEWPRCGACKVAADRCQHFRSDLCGRWWHYRQRCAGGSIAKAARPNERGRQLRRPPRSGLIAGVYRILVSDQNTQEVFLTLLASRFARANFL